VQTFSSYDVVQPNPVVQNDLSNPICRAVVQGLMLTLLTRIIECYKSATAKSSQRTRLAVTDLSDFVPDKETSRMLNGFRCLGEMAPNGGCAP
jgi:hypothetical protein